MAGANLTDRAGQLLTEITPDLLKLLANAPAFGSCGIVATFHENEITRLDISATVQRKPRGTR